MRFASDNLIRSVLIFFTIWLSASLTQSSSMTLLFEACVTIFVSAWMYLAIFKNVAIQNKAKVIWNTSIRTLSKVKWMETLTLLGISMVGFAASNTDRWVAAENLSHDGYAMYAFGGVILILAQSLQSVIGVSFFPYIAKLYGLESKNKAGQISLKFSLGAIIGGLLLSMIAEPAVNMGIAFFFPKYIDVASYVGFFLVVASFRASDFLSGFLIIDGRERHLLAINVLAILSGLGMLIGASAVLNLSMDVTLILWMALIASAVNYFGCVVLILVSIKNLTS
jgi:O-antigen/teichoic acid export membrane protein